MKRRAQPSQGGQKRRKTTKITFGAPSADDTRRVTTAEPSSSAFSKRQAPGAPLPALATLCGRVFAAHFKILFEDEVLGELTRDYMKLLPDPLVPKIFSMIKTAVASDRNQSGLGVQAHVISTYFLRGDTLSLSGDPAITHEILNAIPRFMRDTLTNLSLCDLTKYQDSTAADLVKQLPLLEVVNFRGFAKVGPKTAVAVAKFCRKIRSVNFSSTAVTPASLQVLCQLHPDLEVLKAAAINSFTDRNCASLLTLLEDTAKIPNSPNNPLSNLRTLKLRHNIVSESTLVRWIALCPKLERLDVSFTLLRQVTDSLPKPPLVKLVLTSTFLSSAMLVGIVRELPKLKILAVGAMGQMPGTTTAMMNSAGLILNDAALRELTEALENCPDIENINLVQNTKLGTSSKRDSALADFIKKVGRKCKILNLSGITSLRSADLAPLLPEDSEPASPLQNLVLNKTGVDDDASPWLCSCRDLEHLELAETKFTPEGLFPIIDACTRLATLNLTGCRGVSVTDRRSFFEVWKESMEDEQ